MNTLITARFSEKYLKELQPFINNVRYAGYGVTRQKLSIEEMKREIRDVELLITEFENITEEVLDKAKNLKIIACCRNEPQASVDISAATKRNIPVIFPAGRNAISVAEFTFGLILCLSRNISKTDYLLKYTKQLTSVVYHDKKGKEITSEWSLDPKAPFNLFGGPEFYNKKFGLIGYGKIGSQISRLAAGFSMEILISDPYLNQEAIRDIGASIVDLDTLMKESDFIAVSCKVTPETIGLINRDKIGLMKQTAYIVNTARASIVDYEALYQALLNNKIAGAALDVFPKEPIEADNPFLKLDNVVLTPHLAGSAFEIPQHHSEIIIKDLLLFFNGERPVNILNPQVLEQQFKAN